MRDRSRGAPQQTGCGQRTHPTTAPEVGDGAIEVTDAGANTATPALQAVVIANNQCGTRTFYHDNVYTNNDPSALLFVTPIFSFATADAAIGVAYSPTGCPAGKWTIVETGYASFGIGDTFNVLVVKP